MASLHYAAKCDIFLSLDCAHPSALQPGAIHGKEDFKFCHLATLTSLHLAHPGLHLLAVALAAVAPERNGLGVGPAFLTLSLTIGVESML